MQNTFKTTHFQSGNAMIYVLIVVALFGALTFVLSRQTDTDESNTLAPDRVAVLTGQIINYPFTVKQVLDMMESTGSDADELVFTLPTDAGFNDPVLANNVHKVYHQAGGGLNPTQIPPEAVGEGTGLPAAGWYLGRFNNFEWSNDPAKNEVVLAAYNIRQEICAAINQKLLNDPTIPATSNPRQYFVEGVHWGGGTNATLEIADCPECEDHLQMCVSDGGSPATYVYYSLMINQ